MVKKKSKRTWIVAVAVLVALLVVVGMVTLIKSLNSKTDPYRQTETSSTQSTTDEDSDSDTIQDSNEDATTANDTPTTDTDDDTQTTIDPSTVSTIDIEPMDLTVSYVKGVGGFEFAVRRTANGTQYVEFSSPSLKGTKCTDDEGVFASILASPSTDEGSTITKTVTIDGEKYGLSLVGATCTKDPDLLKKYQASFSDAFSLLKKLQ